MTSFANRNFAILIRQTIINLLIYNTLPNHISRKRDTATNRT